MLGLSASRAETRPLVALESTIISHGLPWPLNLETAQACERAVRDAGAEPATIALLDGRVHVGLSPQQLERVARRAGLGLARCGSVAHHGSGEIFVAFAPPARRPRGEAPAATVPGYDLNDVFEAVVDATEEAVLNALWAEPEVVGREGRVGQALPHDDVLELLAAHGRLDA